MKQAVVAGLGLYLPEKIVTNRDLEATLDTNDEWIRERTGIIERHIAAEDERTSTLAIKAGAEALRNANVDPSEIDLVLVATATPDFTFPGTAPLVQAGLNCGRAAAMDVNGACSGFVYALMLANGMIKAGSATKVLVIGAETMSRVVDWADRGTCILFGDGAGAMVLVASDEPEVEPRGILAGRIYADGSLASILQTSGGVSANQQAGFLSMQGKEVFRHAVAKMTESAMTVMEEAGFTADKIDWVVPHQANARILASCASKLGIPDEKMIVTVDRHANTSAASIPLALADAEANGRLMRGQRILLTALGAGLTWGSCIIRW